MSVSLIQIVLNIPFSEVSTSISKQVRNTLEKCPTEIILGEKVAFVGHSGSGKSTTIQMILRFYDPDAGIVTLDGQNVKDFNLYWYRNQVCKNSKNFLSKIRKNFLSFF